MGEGLLNTAQVAGHLGIKEATLREWARSRKISFVRVGRLVKFEPKVIERFIKENRVKPIKMAS